MAVQEIEGQGFDRSVLEPAVLTDAEAELDCYLFLLKLLFIPQLQDLVDAPAHRTGRFGRRGRIAWMASSRICCSFVPAEKWPSMAKSDIRGELRS